MTKGDFLSFTEIEDSSEVLYAKLAIKCATHRTVYA